MGATQPKLSPAPTGDGNPPTQEAREKTSKSFTPVEWSVLVSQVKAGDDAGMEQLYKLFSLYSLLLVPPAWAAGARRQGS
jgi:hypothetical protein